MSEWKVRIGYLPRDIADEAKHVVFDKIDDDSVQFEVLRLMERAFSEGYETGYLRSFFDESWKQFRAEERARKAAKEAAAEGSERSDDTKKEAS